MPNNIEMRTATQGDLPQLRSIWVECFGALEGQGDLFFEKRFVPEQTQVLCENGAVAAMLFVLPAAVNSKNQAFDARYIYAVGTHPNFQRKGYSKKLLWHTNQQLKAQGIALSFLVPASPSLFDFYAAQGYHNQFFISERHYAPDNGAAVLLVPQSLSALKPLRDRFFGQHPLFVAWDAAALDYCQQDARVQGGEIFYFEQPVSGYAVCFPEETCVVVKELCGEPSPELVNAIARKYDKNKVSIRCVPDNDAQPYGMAMWLLPKPPVADLPHSYLSLVLD